MKEKSEKRNRIIRRGTAAAGLALLGLTPISPTSAGSTSKEIAAPAPVPAGRFRWVNSHRWNLSLKDRGISTQNATWFAGLLEAQVASDEDISKMAEMVKEGTVPLGLQISFMNLTFAPGGYFYKQFTDPDIDPERHSEILDLVNRASVWLTKYYQENPTIDSSLEKYFNIAPLREVSRGIWIENNDGSLRFCNGFLSFAEGDVYFVTADHCIDGTKSARSFARDRKSDIAVHYIPPEKYALPEWNIRDLAALQSLTNAKTPKAVSGAVTASYSLRPDPRTGTLREIVHFSYALPTSQIVRNDLFQGESYTDLGHGTMFLKPHTEGRITRKSAAGSVISIEASGSSGSNVAFYGGPSTGYFGGGTLSSVRVLTDNCRRLCLALAFLGGPNHLRALVEEDRRKRLAAMVSDSFPHKKK